MACQLIVQSNDERKKKKKEGKEKRRKAGSKMIRAYEKRRIHGRKGAVTVSV